MARSQAVPKGRRSSRDCQANAVAAAMAMAPAMVAAFGGPLLAKQLLSRQSLTPWRLVLVFVMTVNSSAWAFASVIGGMLGVGIFHLYEPLAISPGGMGAAAVFAALMTFIYRWGVRGLV